MAYRYLARSVGGFIQQAAVYYIQRGYYFYVLGRVPKGTRCRQIDRKILAQYGIELSKDQRYRRKKKGQANIQYLRYQDTFLLLATEGEHRFFAAEETAIQDARVSPLRVFGYAITHQNGRVLVGLDEETYRHLRADFLRLALRRNPHPLARRFWSLPFEPYGPVYRQVLSICKAVNCKRKTGGLPLVPSSTLRRLRRSYRPFDTGESKTVF
jgi:hypothetical protein